MLTTTLGASFLCSITDTRYWGRVVCSPVEFFTFRSNKGGRGKGVEKEESITVVSYSQFTFVHVKLHTAGTEASPTGFQGHSVYNKLGLGIKTKFQVQAMLMLE